MISLSITDNLRLEMLSKALENNTPLMVIWGEEREALLQQQFSGQLDPENTRLRNLSRMYESWKKQNYPRAKKRELTGKTYSTYTQRYRRNELVESMRGNAIYLQGHLDLPIFPDDWTEPTLTRIITATNKFLDEI